MRDDAVKVHFNGWTRRHDKWLPLDSKEIKLPKVNKDDDDDMGDDEDEEVEEEAEEEEENDEAYAEAQAAAPPSPLIVAPGQHIKVYDRGEWHSAKVMKTSEEGDQALVHFLGWNKRHDKWIDLGNMDVRAPSPTRSPQQLAETRAAEENVEMVDLGSSAAAAAAMAAAAEEMERRLGRSG